MNDLKTRLSNLENLVSNIASSLKKIEDVKKKDDLYSFTNQQLIKWLKDNEVNYNENIKDTLIDIVWKNLNEWEWEYYYEESEESEESEENKDSEESQKEDLVSSDDDNSDDDNINIKQKSKK